MLWSLLKIVLFIGIVAALAYGGSWILETPGEVRIAFGMREFYVSPIGFIVAVLLIVLAALVVLKLIGLLIAVVRFLLGDETAISRYFSRGRERRGYSAFSEGMMAVASGDGKLAMKKAKRADKLLGGPELTKLLTAQAAEVSGDRTAAIEAYKGLLPDDRTRRVGIQGLMRIKLEEGDTDTALALAKKAFALRPDNESVLRTLFELQSRNEDWAGARETLNAAMHARLLPRDVGIRRDAVLSLADARASIAAGDTARGYEAALQANRLAPTLVPAAALASDALVAKASKRKASRLLSAAWGANPHPELAAAFARIEPEESPAARRKRFTALTGAAAANPESRMLEAELALAAEDFPGARKALGDLAETQPTTRSLALMAAIERGQGAPEEVVRGWLAKALSASRGPQWICDKCNHVHTAWVPVCEQCGAFDTLAWRTPTSGVDISLADSTMLPLIIGTRPEAPEPEPLVKASPPVQPGPEVEDAVLASAADQARAAGN